MILTGRISPHFLWTEFDETQQRAFVIPNQEALAADLHAQANIRVLCRDLLEPIRAWWGKPIALSSGYRMPALNAAIGGNPHSDHMIGAAADFRVAGVSLVEVFERIVESDLSFGQAILEPIGPGARWIHLSLPAPYTRHTRQVIR